MSEMKFCQGPECHKHKTKDRIKGMKGSKTYQTRRRSSFYYGNGNFCSTWCQDQWLNKYIEQALDQFGRTTEAKHLTKENAWYKEYDWDYTHDSNGTNTYFFRNGITKEQRPLTEEQYRDSNYTLNTGE
jgi:hypothetical protein